ncbi:hypothetical protein SVIOM342S_05345 [Streptomyces violaceorubidus]
MPQLRRRLGRADLRAVPEARRALRELLRHWGGPGRSEVAELLTSELVTNALVHTEEGAVLTATVGPRALRVEVRTSRATGGSPGRAHPRAKESTNGRGLVLVESLADDWGVRPCEAGSRSGRTGRGSGLRRRGARRLGWSFGRVHRGRPSRTAAPGP